MKKKNIIVISLLITGSVLCWWYLSKFSSQGEVEMPVNPKTSDENTSLAANGGGGATQKPLMPGSVPVLPRNPSKSEQMTEGLSTYNHRPIEFYGKVIDQFGEPVDNALIKGTVLYNSGFEAGVKKTQTKTDGSGFFEFTGLTGKSLGIEVEKEGYQMARSGNTNFVYSLMYPKQERFDPDKNNPFVIEMWRKQGAMALIQYEKKFNISMNGNPLTIGLKDGAVSEGAGDFRVKFTRNPQTIPENRLNYEWNITVEAVNGGLVEITENNQVPEAALEGYQPSYEYRMAADAKPWDGNFRKKFFLKCQNGGQYGKVEVSLYTGSQREFATLKLTVWLNPSGGRNLEYDPANRINR